MATQKMILIPLEKYERIKSSHTKIQIGSQPAQVQVAMEEIKDDPESNMLDKEMIIQTMPKMYRSKGQALLNFIEKGNVLSWNEKGELVHNGSVIPNSNIADLVKDAMREYKNFNPIGKDEFYKGLAQSNIPLLLIDNRSNRDLMMESKSKAVYGKKRRKEAPPNEPPKWIYI